MNIPGKIAKWLVAAAIAAVLVFCAAAGEQAAKVLKIGCPSQCPETVTSWDVNLFIPGNWDLSRMTLEVPGYECIRLEKDGPDIYPGKETDLSAYAGQYVTIYQSQNKKVLKLTFRQGSAIPALFLTVDSNMFKKVRRNKNIEITEGRAVYEEADGSVSYDGGITQLKGRGNNTYSSQYSKKPYQIKLEKKASLSGMARAKTWVLLANSNDISLLRNQIVMDMCRETGLRYALGCTQVDVWVNGTYHGLYLLAEKPQIKKERMDLKDLEDETEKLNSRPMDDSLRIIRRSGDELPLVRAYEIENNPADITGGYLFTIEKYARLRDYKIPGFRTKKELSIRIKEPTYPSMAQTEYLGRRVFEMHQALIAGDGINPDTGKHYTEYMDTDSFALKFLAEEWCKNYDFIGGSQYMYKDSDERDPLIYAGPAWDYDLSFGNMGDRGTSPEGGYITSLSRRASNLYWLLSTHPEFMDRVGEMWKERFLPAAEILLGEREAGEESVIRSLDEYIESIRASAKMNYTRWQPSSATSDKAGGNFDNACDYLKKWIRKRTEFMRGVY